MKRVPLDQRKPGWPKVSPDVRATASYYETDGLRVNSIVTTFDTGTIGALSVAWDMCGVCRKHINRCACTAGVSAPAGVVHCYRQAAGIVPRESAMGGAPYIGLRHNVDGTVAPLVIDDPVERAKQAAEMASTAPAPVTPLVRRTRRVQTVSDDVKPQERVAPKSVLKRRRRRT